MILIVDDNKEIRESLSEYLTNNKLECNIAMDAMQARGMLSKKNYDLIILDIMMPGEDGLSLCRYIFENYKIPVILLTAKDEDTDKIIGLEVGADDYLSKPFNPRELLARIKSVLRRTTITEGALKEKNTDNDKQNINNQLLKFGEWTLNIDQQEISKKSSKPIELSTGEFRLLLAFIENPKKILSRDQLLDIVSNRSLAAFDRSIDNQISRLRKKIELDPKKPKYIKTVWGGGYSFNSSIEKE
jgi:two-component system OmpR family response regulator